MKPDQKADTKADKPDQHADDKADQKPDRPDHGRLSEREDAEQRGEDPKDAIGAPRPTVDEESDPEWQPDPHVSDPWRDLIQEHGKEHRPNREDVLPYLLIRAFAPTDRAVRPIWPPRPSWLSPDILLIDDAWTGPFQADQVVATPTAGRSYRLFVHVWNLGLLAAVGVHVRAWWVEPGFFSGQPGYSPEFIGGAFLDLTARTAPGAHLLAEVMPAWSIRSGLSGHQCLLASVECPADRWSGTLDANADRHVGQRNITILAAGASVAPLLVTLAGALGEGEFLELTLSFEGRKGILYGVPIAGGQHLLVAVKRDERLFILPTTALADLLGEQLPDLSEAGTAAAFFQEFRGRFDELWTDGLDRAFGRVLGTDEFSAERVLAALGTEGSATLHLSSFDAERRPVGGYSIGLERFSEPRESHR